MRSGEAVFGQPTMSQFYNGTRLLTVDIGFLINVLVYVMPERTNGRWTL